MSVIGYAVQIFNVSQKGIAITNESREIMIHYIWIKKSGSEGNRRFLFHRRVYFTEQVACLESFFP